MSEEMKQKVLRPAKLYMGSEDPQKPACKLSLLIEDRSISFGNAHFFLPT